MLAVWQAADDIELFESGWTFDHFYPIFSDSTGPLPRGLGHAHGVGPGDDTPAPRHARDRDPLPAPGGVGEHGGHARHRLGRPAGDRDRRRLERGGIRCLRHRPRVAQSAQRPLRRGLRGPSRASSNETTSFKGAYYELDRARCNPKPLQRPHPPICIGGNGEKRTLRTAARFAQHWNFLGGAPEEFAEKRETLHAHCAELGRDPGEILPVEPCALRGRPFGHGRDCCRPGGGRRWARHRHARAAASARSARTAGGGLGSDRLSGAGKAPAHGLACCHRSARARDRRLAPSARGRGA